VVANISRENTRELGLVAVFEIVFCTDFAAAYLQVSFIHASPSMSQSLAYLYIRNHDKVPLHKSVIAAADHAQLSQTPSYHFSYTRYPSLLIQALLLVQKRSQLDKRTALNGILQHGT
jgi:hypothetical protein